ncbi:hypothetical protein G6F57_005197 [Rhizopus arrhizus]|uniref:Uncharacterized protein n=1 Tax=Rhizopus oryzae TaxID=64495 RepID=A0A9P6XBN1_RHIOR|nr:hypothetical protein G6F23_000980 [Rhizopus arrhizus]KAG1425975.1 hypothetical protein G6F58_001687 [Rhizopus delemar]KAG0764915.1 hypothetical protein G6F24_004846 [Rhizopus arrhizus]KAG0777124.1 hypothetical protein G6F22_012091 [Rhizopus arrhizus]KAG0791618.1 hypothetical protein G6F21_004946 [Rhizopus arrhizus]
MVHYKSATLSVSQSTLVSQHEGASDETFVHLLRMIDKGTETVTGLRKLLITKATELEELVQQLNLINQVLNDVEYGTKQTEDVLKEMRLDKISFAEATLDSALQSAYNLCPNHILKDEDERLNKLLINKLKVKLKQLDIDPTCYFHTFDDTSTLKKSIVNLEIAKTISLCIKSDYKRRNALMKNKNAKEQIKQNGKKLGDKIREEFNIWKMYTRGAPFLIGDEHLIDLLEIQDQQNIKKKKKNEAVLYTMHTSSSIAKLNTAETNSLFKLRKLLIKGNSSWFKMNKIT